jgi:hypothetical protein
MVSMNDTPNIPTAIEALSILSGVPAEEVTVQVASLLAAIGGPHAGLMTLGDEFQPVGFHLLHLGGDSARQRRLTQLLFQPLRYLQEDLLAYSRLAPGKQLDSMARAYVGGRRSEEHLSVDPGSEGVEGIARSDVYHLADLSSQVSSLTSPWRRQEDVDLFKGTIGCKTLLPVDGIHRHLPGYPMLSQSAVGRHEGRCLHEPVVFLDNPRADTLKKPWEGVDRDSPLILDESGRLGLWSIGVKDEVAIQLHQGQREFIHQLETVDSATRALAAGFSNLPVTLLWTLAQLEPTKDVSGEMVSTALALSATAMRNHLAVIRELRRDAESVRVERKAAEMLWKLFEVEPCTFRELMRKYPVQRREVHEPVLNHLVESGKVLRLDSNQLRLTDATRAELTTSASRTSTAA